MTLPGTVECVIIAIIFCLIYVPMHLDQVVSGLEFLVKKVALAAFRHQWRMIRGAFPE